MDINFARLNQLAFGYWHAQTLFSLAEKGVFDLVSNGGKSAAAITQSCGLDSDAGESLLNAGVALGLLRKEDGNYLNTDVSSSFLVSDKPESLVNWVRVMGRWAEPWSRMGKAIEAGFAIDSQSQAISDDEKYREEFILGMHEYASRSSADVAKAVDLSTANNLVDVGGGAGTYSIALCNRHPNLTAVILDLEEVLSITKKLVKKSGLSTRIHTASCDYRKSQFGVDVDAILFSNVLHQESQEVGIDMLRRAHDALADSGKVIVHGHFLENNRTSPVFATLHNLSARTIWDGGHSYTADEMETLLKDGGFTDVSTTPIAASSTKVVVGTKS